MTITNKNFSDWFQENMGYGYGTGEVYTIPALKEFLSTCPLDGNYNYEDLEKNVGTVGTWFLMNILCSTNIIEYGTSPRYGWLTEKGKALKNYMDEQKSTELYDIVCSRDQETICTSNYCNCGEKGYVEGKKCDNLLFNN
jgi:hypothetical protein